MSAARRGSPRRAPERGQAREALIEAAADLARERGLAALSVDLIVERAGVTKGAFFHHFATRRDMVVALIGQLAQAFQSDLDRRVADGAPFARALVDATFAEVERETGFVTTLVTAVALDWSLGPEVVALTDGLTSRMMEEGASPEKATLVRAALDGLFQHCLLHASDRPSSAFMQQLHDALITIVSGDAFDGRTELLQ